MVKLMKPIEQLNELVSEMEIGVVIADGFDDALIGICQGKAVYDREQCIKILMKDMTEDEAREYFEFNVEGAYVGEMTPLWVSMFKED